MNRGAKGPIGARKFLTEEEKKNMPKFSKELLARILSYLKPYWAQFMFVFISITISAFLGLFPAYFSGRIVDTINTPNISLFNLVYYLLLALGTAILSQLITVIEKIVNAWISQKIIHDLKTEMYQHLQYMQHSFFTTQKHGDIVTRMTSDIDGIDTVITGTLSNLVNNVAVVLTTVVALFRLNWILAVFGIIVMPLLFIPNKLVGKKKWKLLTERQAKKDEMNSQIDETLSVSGSHLVKIFAREKVEYERFRKLSYEVTTLAIKEQRVGKWFSAMLGIFSSLSSLFVYGLGGFVIYLQKNSIIPSTKFMTLGTITYAVQMLNRLYKPVQTLLTVQVDFTRSLALFVRIFGYLDMKSEIISKVDALEPDLSENSDVSFNNVCFSYSSEIETLHDISFTLPTGKMYAIVGPTGAGKSTIISLIPRLYDVSCGAVRIGKYDVRDLDLKKLRENIGYVSQDTYLFNATIKENLRYANYEASDKAIEEACKAANIHDFIKTLPMQYDSIVGNRGLKLSGGEKQRIAIARAVLKNPKILILDEATSSLDSISEHLVQNALESIMKGRTCIVIAHRLSTIVAADKILVIKSGRIVEEGTHESLLKSGGEYTLLFNTQFRKVLDKERNESSFEDHQWLFQQSSKVNRNE